MLLLIGSYEDDNDDDDEGNNNNDDEVDDEESQWPLQKKMATKVDRQKFHSGQLLSVVISAIKCQEKD